MDKSDEASTALGWNPRGICSASLLPLYTSPDRSASHAGGDGRRGQRGQRGLPYCNLTPVKAFGSGGEALTEPAEHCIRWKGGTAWW